MAIRQSQPGTTDPSLVGPSILVAALAGGIAAGVLFHTTGWIESVAGMYGLDGVAIGWIIHLLHSLIAGAAFGGLVVFVSQRESLSDLAYDLHDPLSGMVLGLALGLLLWLVVVVLALPLWLGLMTGTDQPIPYLHWSSLAALLLFGGVLAGSYPLVLESLEKTQ